MAQFPYRNTLPRADGCGNPLDTDIVNEFPNRPASPARCLVIEAPTRADISAKGIGRLHRAVAYALRPSRATGWKQPRGGVTLRHHR